MTSSGWPVDRRLHARSAAPRRSNSPSWRTVRPSAVTAPVKCGAASPPSSTPSTGCVCPSQQSLRAGRRGRLRARRGAARPAAGRRPAATAGPARPRAARSPRVDAITATGRRLGVPLDLRADAAEAEAEQRSGTAGPSRKNRKVLLSTVAVKSRRAMTKAARIVSGSFMRLPPRRHMAHLARRRLAGDGDEGVVQAGPLDAQRLDPGAAVDQRLEQRLGAARGQLEPPFAADQLGAMPGAPRATARPRRGCADGRSGAAGRAPRRPRPRTPPCPRR